MSTRSLKLNVDGSAKGNPGFAGIDGLLQNSDGGILALFSIYIGVLNSSIVEVLAIKEACKMVNEKAELRLVNITIESDSLNTVSWVRHRSDRPWRLPFHFQAIDDFL